MNRKNLPKRSKIAFFSKKIHKTTLKKLAFSIIGDEDFLIFFHYQLKSVYSFTMSYIYFSLKRNFRIQKYFSRYLSEMVIQWKS